ncbi:hypothetical protein FXW78_49805 [Rhodococcus opacus]|nr:hypothetical protein [Rhodococcus opacus]
MTDFAALTAGIGFAGGDTMRFEFEGTRFTLKQNGTTILPATGPLPPGTGTGVAPSGSTAHRSASTRARSTASRSATSAPEFIGFRRPGDPVALELEGDDGA